VTTPLDVIKTRLMLGTDSKGVPYKGAIDIIGKLVEEAKSPEGAAHGNGGAGRGIGRVFFAGVQPRVMWISIGGFFFFGAYEQASRFFELIL
jgi:solute carrier family 25 S-adenosylmethionine transporter 26